MKADKLYGKLVVIVDLVDQNRVLVDAPGIKRCIINLKRLALTPIKLDTGRCPDAAALEAAHKDATADKLGALGIAAEALRENFQERLAATDQHVQDVRVQMIDVLRDMQVCVGVCVCGCVGVWVCAGEWVCV